MRFCCCSFKPVVPGCNDILSITSSSLLVGAQSPKINFSCKRIEACKAGELVMVEQFWQDAFGVASSREVQGVAKLGGKGTLARNPGRLASEGRDKSPRRRSGIGEGAKPASWYILMVSVKASDQLRNDWAEATRMVMRSGDEVQVEEQGVHGDDEGLEARSVETLVSVTEAALEEELE